MNEKKHYECVMGAKRYFRDHDWDNLIVRVWIDENGNRRGESWGFKNRKWYEDDKVAWMVADDIYDNHPLTEEMVEEIIGEELDCEDPCKAESI